MEQSPIEALMNEQVINGNTTLFRGSYRTFKISVSLSHNLYTIKFSNIICILIEVFIGIL